MCAIIKKMSNFLSPNIIDNDPNRIDKNIYLRPRQYEISTKGDIRRVRKERKKQFSNLVLLIKQFAIR